MNDNTQSVNSKQPRYLTRDVHFFDANVAGVTKDIKSAAIFYYICHWIHFPDSGYVVHEGKRWLPLSAAKASSFFFYLSPRQIQNSLDLLIKMGFLEKKRLFKNKMDNTNYFSILKREDNR